MSPLALALLLPGMQQPPSIPLREVLAVERLGTRARSAIYTDALEARLARGQWQPPREGDTIRSADVNEDGTRVERTWTRYTADDDGHFEAAPFRGGWAYATIDVPSAGPWRLDASGHALVIVDGEPHAGDPYGLGVIRHPLALEAGPCRLLFRAGRGRLRAILEPAPASLYVEERDATLPDVVRGESGRLWLGVVVANATPRDRSDLGLVTRAAGSPRGAAQPLPTLLASSCAKVAAEVEVLNTAWIEADELEVEVSLVRLAAPDEPLHSTDFTLAVADRDAKHARTFRSRIDASVQYFAVTPPAGPAEPTTGNEGPPALFLSLHGASVEARNQAYSYAPRPGGVIVAPTNRRPFGFDWEDQGRLDALEVLALAERLYRSDPRRTYLTGHSMGGHGTWQLGAHFPDRFAAIAPSAGWSDFWSYTGLDELPLDDPIGAELSRAVNASRTRELLGNLARTGVYVLHGDADDNVPVSQARLMRRALAEFHPNFAYYERPGAGHWWGNECMDWPPLFAFLEANVAPAPAEILDVDFTTVNPALSSRCHWLVVESQTRPMVPTRARARLDLAARTIELEAENLGRVAFDLAPFLEAPDDAEALLAPGPIHLRRNEELRELTRGPDSLWRVQHLGSWYRSAARNGPFKDVFRNGMVFVHGTRGTPEETAWARAKARLDQETWRYRGNGSVQVIADVDFEARRYRDRNVILYGNQDTNAAWADLLGGSGAFEVRRTFLRVGSHRIEGDDLALLACYPRAGSDTALVGVVAGTGLPGSHLTDHLPYFVSGVAYPDWTVIGTEMLTEGLPGVRGTGWFRDDWSTEEGAEAVWR